MDLCFEFDSYDYDGDYHFDFDNLLDEIDLQQAVGMWFTDREDASDAAVFAEIFGGVTKEVNN